LARKHRNKLLNIAALDAIKIPSVKPLLPFARDSLPLDPSLPEGFVAGDIFIHRFRKRQFCSLCMNLLRKEPAFPDLDLSFLVNLLRETLRPNLLSMNLTVRVSVSDPPNA
jgi:hypothetical protein